MSRDFRFITATALGNRKRKTIWSALKQVKSLHQSKGHKIEEMEFSEHENALHTILMDNEFETLIEEIEEFGIKININAKEEHVPEVERQNHVIKERARGIVQTLFYAKKNENCADSLCGILAEYGTEGWTRFFTERVNMRGAEVGLQNNMQITFWGLCTSP
jgi:phosphatidate phosphatase PAH1